MSRTAAAARYLREIAKGATPGPWSESDVAEHDGALIGPADDTTEEVEVRHYGGELVGESVQRSNLAYLRVVSPLFAVAVADLLDALEHTDYPAVFKHAERAVEAIEQVTHQ